uniref:Uncharacterized protein n=1 Tax=Cryptomonas curvata TaxID=233186 RepID=A0A7S0QXF4_9CRYP|mmetsp:Transcript_57767/g.120789  ORF Transcript_57767/g.120789 Transcript_57767/m.120789 type:complete len:125 (+) Transcript_57767:60-434(+)
MRAGFGGDGICGPGETERGVLELVRAEASDGEWQVDTARAQSLFLGARTGASHGPWLECTAESHLSPAWCPPGFPCFAASRSSCSAFFFGSFELHSNIDTFPPSPFRRQAFPPKGRAKKMHQEE